MSASEASLLDHIDGDSQSQEWIRTHLNYPHKNWCLLWPFGRKQGGYAAIGKPSIPVHRIMCEHRNGPPPTEKHQAAHSCGRGHDACVNQWHLDWKTNAENQIDRYQHSGPTKRTKLTPEDVDAILALKGRARVADIAIQFGVIELTIHRIHQGKLWRNTSTLQRHVLTEAQVREIRATPWQVKSAKDFAKEFGVVHYVIQRIRSGKTYKWVSETAEPLPEFSRADRGAV